jgi:tRNA(adenine34) deaminase
MSHKSDNYWDILSQLAQKAADEGEVPVAALLVKNRHVIAQGYNLVETLNDPTLHAEIVVLREGFKQLGKYLTECDLYVTLEPCPMCAHALKLSKIRRLYFGAYDPKGGGIEHGARCLGDLNRLQVFGGFHEKRFNAFLTSFFDARR